MADVSPGGVPEQGATPPASEAPTSAFPGSSAPAAPYPVAGYPGGASAGADYAGGSSTGAGYPGGYPGGSSAGAGYAGGAVPAYPGVSQPAAGYPAMPFLPGPTEASATAPHIWRDPATGRARSGWRRWLPIGVVITLILAGAVGMLLFLGVNFGGIALLVGIIAAVIPVPLLVAAFLWLDRYEPEPIHLLAFCFAWGATVATSVALLVNTGAAALFDKLGLSESLVAVLIAPLIEESMKASGPLLLFWRRREEWSGITDGIVYCGLSALGFAMVENVLYLGGHGYAAGADKYGAATGLQNVFAIFIVRILFTGFAHPLFTSMTGIGLGISSRSGDRRVRWLAPIAGLLVAMMLHGTFNLLPTLSVSLSQPFIMLYGYLGFMVPFFFAVVGFAIALRGWEGRIAERILPYYVRTGWFAPPEVAALGSLGRRYSARQWAGRVAGPAGQRAMKGFQFAATQLALLRDGMQRGLHRTPAALQRAEAEEQRLLSAIVDYRSSFTGRDPQMPQAFWNGEIYQIAFPDGVVRSVRPPEEPVVPVPIKFAQAAYAGYGINPGAGYAAAMGYPTPGYGASAHGAAGQPYGNPPPGYGSPSHGPASGVPGYGVPASGVPGYGVQGYGGPAADAPAYGVPASGAPGYGAPGYGAAAHGAAAHGAPGYGAAAHGAPGYGAPGYGAPGYGEPAPSAPTYGAPAPSAPGYGAPAHEAPPSSSAANYGTPNGPSYGAPNYAASEATAPEFGAAGYGSGLGQGASGYGSELGGGAQGYGSELGRGASEQPGAVGPAEGSAGRGWAAPPEAVSQGTGAEEHAPSGLGGPTPYRSSGPTAEGDETAQR